MFRNSITKFPAVLLAIGFSGLLAPIANASITDRQIEQSFNRLEPSVCIVSYASEVSNPNTGELSRRNTRALGLIVSPKGLIMVHGHMQVQDSEPFNITVEVGLGDDVQTYDATLLKKPEDVNVCFVQIESDEPLQLPFVRFAERDLAVGESILIVGLLGDVLDFSRTVMVRRIGSVLEKPRRTYTIDERLPFGAVGGPVVNAAGDVVGVVGFDLSVQEGGDLYVRSGHPLVYQTALFQNFIDNPSHAPEQEEAWLGVFTQPLTDDLAEYWGLPNNGGVVVASLVPGSPAIDAGFLRGDVITKFNDTPIRARQNQEVLGFTKLVRDAGIGKEVSVDLYRDGKPMTIQLTLASRPKTARDAGEFETDLYGLTVRELTTDVRIALNLNPGDQGVIVRRVKLGSWAFLSGMRAGVIILDFGGHKITSIEDFQQAIDKIAEEKPTEISVLCRAGSQTRFFRLQPRWESAAD